MPILNYTTKTPVSKTVAEISQLLAKKGAKSITQEYGLNGKVVAFRFVFPVGGVNVPFLMPTNAAGVFQHMQRSAPPRFRNREQAERVSWRILKDWLEAQIALVESSQAEIGQVFMPYAQQRDGRTMYQLFVENNQKQLGAGGA